MSATVADEYRALDDLRPHPRNYNQHEWGIPELAAAMRLVAYTAPMIIKPDGTILAGHGRRLALQKLREDGYAEPAGVLPGWQVPCRVVECNAVDELRILATDNPDAARVTYDTQALASILTDLQQEDALEGTWYDADRLAELLGGTEEEGGSGLLPDADPDAVPESAPTRCQPGDIWALGHHRLLCGDCTDRLNITRLMDGATATMMFTDPPWNVGIGVDSNPRHRQRALSLENDTLPAEEFSAFLSAFIASVQPSVAGDVYCVLVASEWPTLDSGLRGAGYHWSGTIIWVKDAFVLGRSKYHSRYESIWYGWHESGTSSHQGRRDLDDVWEVPRPRRSEDHPTMKPVALVQKAIEASSAAGDLVLDPFLGSGTTLIAAESTGRKCYGAEISPTFCDVILRRWEEATGHVATLLNRAIMQEEYTPPVGRGETRDDERDSKVAARDPAVLPG